MDAKVDARNELRRIPLFASTLEDFELDALAAVVKPVHFAKGETIIAQGDLGSSMFLICTGKANVTLHAPGGPRPVASLGKDDFIGEMSLLTGAARSATVKASGPVEALEVTKAALAPVLEQRPKLIEELASVVKSRRSELDALQRHAIEVETHGFSFAQLVAKMTAFYKD